MTDEQVLIVCVTLLIIAAMVITHSAWPLFGVVLLFMLGFFG